MYYVYSLKCNDGFYIGCINDLKDIIRRHKAGQVDATKESKCRKKFLQIYSKAAWTLNRSRQVAKFEPDGSIVKNQINLIEKVKELKT